MNKKKVILVSSVLLSFSIGLSSCDDFISNLFGNDSSESSNEEQTNIDELLQEIYKKAKDNGFIGSFDEWINSLKGEKGNDGVGISSITKVSSEGNVDTYLITFTDETTKTYTITNGNGITSITKTSTDGLVDTYTISYSDGTSSTFIVTNGSQGIQGIQGVKGEDGHTPVITIGENGNWYIDGVDTTKPSNIKGDTGNGISNIEKTNTEGLVDTYTITYTNGETFTYTITNGEKGETGSQGVSVVNAYVNDGNHLIIELSNGSTKDAGLVGTTELTTVYYTVNFYDGDIIIKSEQVEKGDSATEPDTIKAGYKFKGWDKSFTNVKDNISIYATYEKVTNQLFFEYEENDDGTITATLKICGDVCVSGFEGYISYDLTGVTLNSIDTSYSSDIIDIDCSDTSKKPLKILFIEKNVENITSDFTVMSFTFTKTDTYNEIIFSVIVNAIVDENTNAVSYSLANTTYKK